MRLVRGASASSRLWHGGTNQGIQDALERRNQAGLHTAKQPLRQGLSGRYRLHNFEPQLALAVGCQAHLPQGSWCNTPGWVRQEFGQQSVGVIVLPPSQQQHDPSQQHQLGNEGVL